MKSFSDLKLQSRKWLVIVILFVTGIAANTLYSATTTEDRLPDLEMLPKEIGGWHSFEVELNEPTLLSIDADETLMRMYYREDERIGVYIGYHSSKKGGRPNHLPPACYPSAGWQILSTETKELPVAGKERTALFDRMIVTKAGETELVQYWFQSGGKVMATGWELNVFRIRARLSRQPYGSAFVRLSTPISEDDPGRAERIIESWTERIIQFLASGTD